MIATKANRLIEVMLEFFAIFGGLWLHDGLRQVNSSSSLMINKALNKKRETENVSLLRCRMAVKLKCPRRDEVLRYYITPRENTGLLLSILPLLLLLFISICVATCCWVSVVVIFFCEGSRLMWEKRAGRTEIDLLSLDIFSPFTAARKSAGGRQHAHSRYFEIYSSCAARDVRYFPVMELQRRHPRPLSST